MREIKTTEEMLWEDSLPHSVAQKRAELIQAGNAMRQQMSAKQTILNQRLKALDDRERERRQKEVAKKQQAKPIVKKPSLL